MSATLSSIPRLIGAALASTLTASAVAQQSASDARKPNSVRAPVASKVQLSDEAELARAVLLYDSGRYAECVAEFEPLVAESSERKLRDRVLVERARVYLAACLMGTGQVARADEVLRKAVRANPQMSAPNGLVFPQAVVDRFLRVRQELIDEIRRAEQEKIQRAKRIADEQARRLEAERWRTKELEYLASQQVVIHENRRWIAAVPFGAGQFQNRQPALGWVFLTTEVLLSGAVITSLVVEKALSHQVDDPLVNPEDLEQKRNAARMCGRTSS